MDELYDVDWFNQGLMEHLIWHNTGKVMRRLGRLSPFGFYPANFANEQQSNMLWTRANNWQRSN